VITGCDTRSATWQIAVSTARELGANENTAPNWMLKELAEEVDSFIELYQDRLDNEFKSRYGFDFSPELWDSTPIRFPDDSTQTCPFLVVATGRQTRSGLTNHRPALSNILLN
jgi:hypothetical protein